MPRRVSVKANVAAVDATAMSVTATSPAPPPIAAPWTRATTGIGRSWIARNIPARARESATFSSRLKSAIPRIQSMSAPAQNVSPSLWRTTARAAGSIPRIAEVRSAMSSASKAFFRSGRSSVIRTTRRASTSERTAVTHAPGRAAARRTRGAPAPARARRRARPPRSRTARGRRLGTRGGRATGPR